MNTGNSLVATPSVIGDFNFHRSIILLTNYQKSGSVGFILNKKLDYLLNDVMEGFDSEFPLYFGGPVEQDNLFYIHTLGDKISNSKLISDELYWNGDFSSIKNLLNKGKLNESNIRFFLGYSGWTEGQLEEEIRIKSWEPFEIKSALELMKMPHKEMWRDCMSALGGDYLLWSNTPENPGSN
jgi:putative transcriptional regulator